jgi:hypothetical protein
MNSAQINTIQAMLHELTPEQLANIESAVVAHYRTNIVQRIQWFETAELLQVGAFIGAGNPFVYEAPVASSTFIEPIQAAEATKEPEEEPELEPYDDEAQAKLFQHLSYGKKVAAAFNELDGLND